MVSMTKSTFKKEHKKLVKILRSGSQQERLKEARDQASELRKY